ncbi:MAG TPA: ATP-binding protein, partial [Magnetospirillaceae bacterium]|nr:ATP-binding protein [Magnetospirillaceae bacterium]
VSHPFLQGERVREKFPPNQGDLLLARLFAMESGYTAYSWHEPGGTRPRARLVYHKRLVDFDWVVGTAIYLDEARRPFYVLAGVNITIAFAAVLALTAAVLNLLRHIDRPLRRIIETLRRVAEGDLTVRAEMTGLRELDEVSRHLDFFLQELREKNSALGGLTSAMAHGLNSPLGAILSATESLEVNLGKGISDQKELLAGLSEPERAAFFEVLDRARERGAGLFQSLDRGLQSGLEAFLADRGIRDRQDIVDAILFLGLQGDPDNLDAWLSTESGTARLLAASRGQEAFLAVQLIREAGLEASNVVQSLQNYIQTGSTKTTEVFSPADEVTRMLDTFRGRIREGLTVRKDCDPAAYVVGDRSRLSVVWNTLIGNALDSMKNRGELGIQVALDGGRVRIEVSDTGPGINPAVRDRIFDPRLTAKPLEPGAGIGLLLAHRIIQDHGGSLEVESRPGRTVFRVFLPAAGVA